MKRTVENPAKWSATFRSRAAERAVEAAHPRRTMRLAYLTTEYPAVSHTFIRREIVELARRGHEVSRLAIRRTHGTLVDPADVAEERHTTYVLPQGAVRLLAAAAGQLVRQPGRWLRALRETMGMSRRSERGRIVHLAYLVEACWLVQELKRRNVEHLHVHFGTNAAAVARLVRTLGGPTYSMTVHGPDEFDAPVGLSLSAKATDASAVVAITHYCAAQLRRWTPAACWDRIHVVRCTPGEVVDVAPAAVSETSRTFLCVGRLTAQKGQLLLIEAMRSLADEGVDVKLVLAGDGEMRGALERRIAELDLGGRVEITGWVNGERIRELLGRSRAMVLPSFAEGLPVVIMEAFALGRPVISTYVAGIPELVEPGVSGWLTPAGDVDALARAMREALAAPAETLTAMGRAGHAAVRVKHDVGAEVDKLEAMFDSCAGRGA